MTSTCLDQGQLTLNGQALIRELFLLIPHPFKGLRNSCLKNSLIEDFIQRVEDCRVEYALPNLDIVGADRASTFVMVGTTVHSAVVPPFGRTLDRDDRPATGDTLGNAAE